MKKYRVIILSLLSALALTSCKYTLEQTQTMDETPTIEETLTIEESEFTSDEEEENETYIDWSQFETVMNTEEYQALQEYLPVLNGEEDLVWTENAYSVDKREQKRVSIDELCDTLYKDYNYNTRKSWVNSVALCDMDVDGSKELILLLEHLGGHYLILYREDDTFYGIDKVYRGFLNLQTNGVYLSSGGAARSYYYKLKFEKNDFQEILLGNTDFDDEKKEPVYYIGEDAVEYSSFEAWLDSIMAEEAIYYEVNSDEKTVEETQEKLTVEEAWELIKKEYSFFETSELEEISYDERGNFQVVINRFYHPFSDEEKDRLCESLFFFNCEEEDYYQFGHHYIYYEEDEETVYATQTKGWYEVNYKTGEVSRW